MAFFLYWAFTGIDLRTLLATLAEVSVSWLATLVAAVFATLVLRAWRWQILMRPFTTQVTLWDATKALGICYASNLFIPRSGELLRALSLKWTRGASVTSVLGTVLVERIIDLVGLVLFVGISVMLLRDRIHEAFPWLGWASIVVSAACLFALVGLVLISLHREKALVRIERILTPVSGKLADSTVRLVDTFVKGLGALHNPSAYLEILLSSALLNFGYILIIYIGFLASEISLGWDAALVIMALSAIGMTAPTPGGSGAYHLLFKEGLILLYGVPDTPALACATLVHAVSNLSYLLFGGPALLLQRRKHRDNQETDPFSSAWSNYVQIVTKTGSEEEARAIGRQAVTEGLAVAAHVSGPVMSVYRWKGKVEEAKEWVCAIKTTGRNYSSVENLIRGLHSYEIPCIIAIPIVSGSAEYLGWIDDQLA